MIDLEQRLQHAARELREIEIEPPPLRSLTAGNRPRGWVARIPALVVPAMFVLGGLALVAGGIERGDTSGPDADHAAAVATPVAASRPVGTPVLTAREEIALIASLAPAGRSGADRPAPRSLQQRYR